MQRANFAGFKTCVPKIGYNNLMKFNSYGLRSFSSLPDHIKLEMPNLSPTMEKVSFTPLINRETSENGTLKLETKLHLEMFSALLRLIKLLSISRCKRRVSLVPSFTTLEPKTFPSELFWLSWSKMKMILALSKTIKMTELLPDLPQLLLLPLRLRLKLLLPLLLQQPPPPLPLNQLLVAIESLPVPWLRT